MENNTIKTLNIMKKTKTKITYEDYCMGSKIYRDGSKIEEDSEDSECLLMAVFGSLRERYSSYELLKLLIESYGEYEDTDQCQQCGHWDTMINLEI